MTPARRSRRWREGSQTTAAKAICRDGAPSASVRGRSGVISGDRAGASSALRARVGHGRIQQPRGRRRPAPPAARAPAAAPAGRACAAGLHPATLHKMASAVLRDPAQMASAGSVSSTCTMASSETLARLLSSAVGFPWARGQINVRTCFRVLLGFVVRGTNGHISQNQPSNFVPRASQRSARESGMAER